MFDGFDLNDKFIVKLADTNDASKIHSLIKVIYCYIICLLLLYYLGIS